VSQIQKRREEDRELVYSSGHVCTDKEAWVFVYVSEKNRKRAGESVEEKKVVRGELQPRINIPEAYSTWVHSNPLDPLAVYAP
jgi:hypothetical protein